MDQERTEELMRLLHPVIRQYIAIQNESDYLYWDVEDQEKEQPDEQEVA